MFRFTIRDVLWLMVVVAAACGWFVNRRHEAARRQHLQAEMFEARHHWGTARYESNRLQGIITGQREMARLHLDGNLAAFNRGDLPIPVMCEAIKGFVAAVPFLASTPAEGFRQYEYAVEIAKTVEAAVAENQDGDESAQASESALAMRRYVDAEFFRNTFELPTKVVP